MSNDLNPFGANKDAEHGAVARTDGQRAIAEVQAAMMIARANPRDIKAAMQRVLDSCARRTLAEAALYSYSRGGTAISGPSIRLAETIAQCWGNMQFGFRELEHSHGESTVQAFAWDVEANTRREVTWTVRHIRVTKKGSYALEDPRDIYELVANEAARRARACILAVIPGDVTEAAVRQCELTMTATVDTSPDTIAKMIAAFEQLGVRRADLEARIQRRLEAIQPEQVVALKKIYASLRDGMSTPATWFAAADQRADKRSQTERVAQRVREALHAPACAEAKASEGEGDGSSAAPTLTYAMIADRIQHAEMVAQLDDAADLIGAVPDVNQRAELSAQYHARKAALLLDDEK